MDTNDLIAARTRAEYGMDELRAENERLRAALSEIESWRNDMLGARPKETGEFDCAPELTEAFDRGSRMAFYRCSDRANKALHPEQTPK